MTKRLNAVRTIVLLAALAGAAGCSPVRVSTDYDPTVDFADLHTYAWLAPLPGMDPVLRNDLMESRVHRAVDHELALKGYARIDDVKAASFGVNYFFSLGQQLDIQTVPTAVYGYGYGYWGGPYWYGQTYVSQYEVGTLILDVVDKDRGRLLWRGTGSTRTGYASTPEKKDQLVNEIVAQILAKFPPPPPAPSSKKGTGAGPSG